MFYGIVRVINVYNNNNNNKGESWVNPFGQVVSDLLLLTF